MTKHRSDRGPWRRPRAGLVVGAAALAAVAACGPTGDSTGDSTGEPATQPAAEPATRFHEEFDGATALTGWTVVRADLLSGAAGTAAVVNGGLELTSPHTRWLHEEIGFGVSRPVVGDVDVVARVGVRGTATPVPDIDWSLAGIMLRDPEPGPEDWIHWTVGDVEGPVLERKRTSAGSSILQLLPLPSGGPVDLRMIRRGDRVVLAYRQDDDPWTVAYAYVWTGMPTEVELVLTAQSGGEGDHADMVARTELVDVAPATFDEASMELLAGRDAGPLNG